MVSLLPDWAPNVHPLIVHFPIAWWIGAVMLDLVALTLPRAAWAETTASILYPAGAISAGMAYLTGRQAAATVHLDGMADPIVLEHWNWALVTVAGFVLLAAVRIWLRFVAPPSPRWVRTVFAAAALVALVGLFETGERGARLVFGHGVGVAAPGGAGLSVGVEAQGQRSPQYLFDPAWPRPLPNKWKIGGITGLAVDKDDNVWVLNRPNDLTEIELHAERTPPLADCCVRPPSMIHFNRQGDVIGSFDAPQGHGMDVDSKGFVYIGQDTVRKYDPATGTVVAQAPRAPDREGGAAGAPPPRLPGRGSQGPVIGFLTPPGGRGQPTPEAAAKTAAARAAFRATYPPTTPMIVGIIEEIRIDESANEIYAADSYLGGRVMVFALDTLAFKRGWGAYGKPLSQISTDEADRAYTPGGPMPKEFRGHLTLNVSSDGLVYAADRNANRLHVTTREGTFLKEFVLAPTTGAGGSTGGVAFSPDPQQRHLFISDLTNNHIWFLNRTDGTIVGRMGTMGENGGQFFGLHMIAVDSTGNIYTGEVFAGERVQRFVPAASRAGRLLEQVSRLSQ